MTKPVTVPNTFASQVGNVPASQLDNDFNALAAAINDTATYGNYAADTGSVNAITVATPANVTFTYQAGVWFDVLMANTNTSPTVTLTVNGVGAVPVVGPNGAALPVGALVTATVYRLVFDGTSFRVGALLYPQTAAEIAAGVTPTNYSYQPGDVRRFGAILDGVVDDTLALNNTILSWNGRGVVTLAKGTLKVTGQIVLPKGVRFQGAGYSESNGTGAANRGATCILRAFVGASCTVLAGGDDCGVDLVDIDNNLQGTGECLQVTGSRFTFGQISTRNSGGDGLRIGKTDSGASTINANAWSGQKLITCGNAGAGFRIDDTNTTTSASYPLGASNANAGFCAQVDARSNGTDGLQLGNCNDNVFGMVVSQFNTGCGIRFKTDGTNAGPRCNKILGNDCEANTGNDIQIDAATLPLSGPGLYNLILGNRSIAVNSRIVDNSTGSLVIQWTTAVPTRGYHFATDLNVLNLSGAAGLNMAAGANAAPARIYAVASGATDSIMRGQIHKNGGTNVDAWETNQYGVFRPLLNFSTLTYTTGVSMTPDAAQGCDIDLTINDNVAWTINAPLNPVSGQNLTLTVRNTSGGALGAATFNAAFKQSAWTSPATGNSRSITWKYNGSNWVEKSRTPADVPN